MPQCSDASSPRAARKARTEAIIADLPKPPSSSKKAVPQWLVEEQNRHRQNRPPPNPSPPSTQPPPNSTITPDNDFIIVDFLDGAHLPTDTRRTPPQVTRMSTTSDSIISLPPVHGPPNWRNLNTGERKAFRRAMRTHPTHASDSTDFITEDLRRIPLSRAPTPPRPSQPQPLPPPPNGPHSPPSQQPFQNPASLPPSAPPDPNARRDSQVRLPINPNSRTPLVAPIPQKSAHSHTGSYSWYDDETDTWAPSATSSVRANYLGQPHRRFRQPFRPSEWGWRKPAEQDAIMPAGAWIYLALIGALTFIIARCVVSASDFLSDTMEMATARVSLWFGHIAGVVFLAFIRGLSLALSFAFVLHLSPHYGAGSGIPEMKCVLGGILMPQMLNWQTLVAKMGGLVFALASKISIGMLGPFIHMSCITAALVAKLNIFPALRDNTRFQMQALSAAMAAGVGATFGAPIGGTMLAIEIMSTYYFIHWLPMALYCSIMGYFFVVAFQSPDSTAYFTSSPEVDLEIESLLKLFTYVILGLACGVLGAALVHFTKLVFKLRRLYFKNAMPWRTTAMLLIFAMTHTFITYLVGGLLEKDQRSGVEDLFGYGAASSEHWIPYMWKIFPSDSLNAALALLIVMMIKFVLAGMSIVMPVPAGTFMPIFMLGAIVGRLFGEGWRTLPLLSRVDPRATAIIGAAALTAGSLHTTSVAVVMLELTREAIDVLPLALGVIVSYGVSKQLCSDLFSELIRIRRLPYMLGLRERYPWETKKFYEDAASELAGSLMKKNFAFVTPWTTRGEIYEMLTAEGRPWTTCAFLSDKDSRRLWGTVSQQTLWDVVKEDMRLGSDGRLEEPEYGTFDASHGSTMRGLETVEWMRKFDPAVGHALVDMGPMQVSFHTPFWKIVTLFEMLSMSQVYVMKDGVTVGYVSKAHVIGHTVKLEERAKRKQRLRMNLEAQKRWDEKAMAENLGYQGGRGGVGGRMRSRLSAADLAMANAMATRQRPHSRQSSITSIAGGNRALK